MKRGKLIVIDGSDGVGKATQTKLLKTRLRKSGKKVSTIAFAQYKENLIGALIRETIDGEHGDFVKLDPYIVSVLFAADRYESKSRIEKWLKEGQYVIIDRYVSSNMIHQGGKIRDTKERKKFLKWLTDLEYGVFGLPRPDVTIYLDLPTQLAQKLLQKRAHRDRSDTSLKYQQNAQESALKIIAEGGKWHRVVCNKGNTILPREVIHEQVYQVLRRAKVV